MRFATKIIIFYLLFTLCVILPVAHHLYQSGQQMATLQIQAQLQERAHHLLDTVDRVLFERQADTQLMALTIAELLPDIPKVNKQAYLKQYLQRFLDFYQIYASISIYDHQRIRIVDTENLGLNQAASTSEWVYTVYEQGEKSVGEEVYYDPLLQQTVLIFAVPMYDLLGTFWGAVVAKVPIELLYNLLSERLTMNSTQIPVRVILLDHGGVVLHDSAKMSAVLRQVVPARTADEMARYLGNDAFYTVAEEQGYLDFAGNQWRLVMKYPRKEAFAATYQLRDQAIVLGLSALVIAILILSFLANRLVQPLTLLRQAAAQVGQGDFNQTINIKGKDEFAELAHTFNQMLQTIAQQIQALQQREQAQTAQNHLLTAQKQQLTETTEILRQFKTCLDLSNDGIYLLDPHQAKFIYVNEGAAHQLGYSVAELMNKSPFELNIGLTVATDIKQFPIFNGKKNSMTLETHYCRPDGSNIPVEVMLQRLHLRPDQEVIIGIVRDMSERYQAKQRLEQKEAFLRFIIDNIPQYIFWKDRNSKFLGCNQSFAHVAGVANPDELLGKDDFDLHWQAQAPSFYEREQRIMRSDKGEYYIEEYLRTDGSMGYVEIRKLPLHDSQNEVIGLLGTAEDISERRQAELALEQARDAAEAANRAKSTFLANMSHELRTPLNGILGYAQILIRDRSLTEKQREGVHIIQRSGEYLLTLINDVLDLSKIEADTIELYCIDFDLPNFINSLVELFQIRAEQKGIALIYETTTPLPAGLHGDEKRLRQILMNLLGNAVKFTEQGGVTLSVGYQHDTLTISISDTGLGIADADYERIFLPFQQAGKINYKAEGTGLGLTITRRLLDMMGGHLQLHSVLHQGSTFTVSIPLPIVLHFTQSKQATSKMIVGFEQATCRLLVVDDRAENRSVLVNLLQPLGFEVETAENGAEGLAKIKANPPDAVLTDLVMPVLDGFEMVRQLRQQSTLQQLPVLAISASVFEQDQAESIAAGCTVFLTKPIRAERLLSHLQEQLHLTWIYETIAAPITVTLPATEAVPMMPPTSTTALTFAQADYLYERALMGDVSAVLTTLDELMQQNPAQSDFFVNLRNLASCFEMDEICECLEPYREMSV